MAAYDDAVFKALADPTRRGLLDELRARDGLTLIQLASSRTAAGISRQAVSKHLGVLESAGLVVTERRGRERLHHLNSGPIAAIEHRWIGLYTGQTRALSHLKSHLEGTAMSRTFTHTTYIAATPDRLWEALTSPEFTREYWAGREISSTWEAGAPITLEYEQDGSRHLDIEGEVLECDPHRLLRYTFTDPTMREHGLAPTVVTYSLAPEGNSVRLTVTHEGLADETFEGVSQGWPGIISSLKSVLETGAPLVYAD